ncbi:MAG: formate/nitrite transporter family protein [Chthoniobacterales bacterium]
MAENITKGDYIKPGEVLKNMIQTGTAKATLPLKDMLIRGFLSGALLAFSTTLAIGVGLQSFPALGALVFPVGFIIIILLGLELVTGNFALLPLSSFRKQISTTQMLSNFFWVFMANLLGSLVYAVLFWVSLSMCGQTEHGLIGNKIAAIAQAKTTYYAAHGSAGLLTVFVKAILCNWMVCLAVVMAMTSSSTIGKIVAAWLPVFIFFAQGFEHAVVNMFMIPAGMLFGADISISQWWLWNQIPVTIGNFLGGFIFTGLALYLTYRPKQVSYEKGGN